MNHFRIGHGYDIHPFEKGKPLILGGVAVPYEAGMKAHSDGDVVVHAICDALLGGAGLGDIGQHFPDTDPQYRQADSLIFLNKIHLLILSKGWKVGNIDVSIVAQVPKLSPYIFSMRQTLANILAIEISEMNIKATTNEKLDAVGRAEAIAVHAVALLIKQP